MLVVNISPHPGNRETHTDFYFLCPQVTRENFPDRREFGLAVAGHLRKTTAVAHAKDMENLVAWLGRQAAGEVNQAVKFGWPEDRPQARADLTG